MAERLPPEMSTRAAAASDMRAEDGGQVIDVDYVTLRPGPQQQRIAPALAPPSPQELPAGLAALRKADAPSPALASVPGGFAFWLFGIGLVAASFWIAGGHALISR